jgi:hypothetical protein
MRKYTAPNSKLMNATQPATQATKTAILKGVISGGSVFSGFTSFLEALDAILWSSLATLMVGVQFW